MRILFLSTLIISLLTSCATKNAFANLDLNSDQEKAIENTRSAKILFGEELGGLVSAVYLNNIHKDYNKNQREFYISIYMKEGYEKLNFTLNGKKISKKLDLPKVNEYSKLLIVENRWAKEYLLTFEDTKESRLNLVIDSDQFSSGPLKYLRDSR